ncbi:ankyrin repeat domain-containing protein [Rhodococcoides corynebacterioides]|uniref:Ankyrin repeat domain-containing protein n=1 Tax=Rhodococcoides corynebacterioides TaxID=53972 RepID=A0ABS7PC41_9NOCA|nr:ankyrin repeat domain-containing protein [Rhodococcus corynebacterioides]MBY6368751.1 ankyrin repeat domain-containing protein [Rhodococcus corynebacterioides]MBY6409922.1 ankyrin repeat domain-containing protein [Rhodococcus corynebacterioides]
MSGANPDSPDADETIPADVADLATRVFDMARAGEATTLAAYVDAGVPVDLTNDSGDTLLMLAAYHGHSETVTALIHRGADVGRANDRGQTPLAGAVFKGEDDVVRALVDAGADPDAGRPSAVDAARMFGRDDYLDLLGRRGTSGPVG